MEGDEGFAERRVGSKLLGKYSLERLLGVGGMASVYRGIHRNGHRVAVKVLHPGLAANADLRERFLREGYLANKVDHGGAVRVLDDDVDDDGAVFLVMELLEGETLAARRERRGNRLEQREVAELTHQLLDVLAAAHAHGVVHRDIKPENLFITNSGGLKVLDFGIARLREPAGTSAVPVTRTGGVLGTPAYMPPEQILGRSREIDGQTDLWSVGATMFTLLSGQYVHDAETVEELIVYAGSRRARPLGSVAPDVARALTAVVDRALAFDKADRWRNSRAMQVALEEASACAFEAPRSVTRSFLAATILAPVPALVASPRTQVPTAATTGAPPALDATQLLSSNASWLPTQVVSPHATSTTAGVVETAPRSGAPRRMLWSGLSAMLIVALGVATNVVVAAASRSGGASLPSSSTLPTGLAPPSACAVPDATTAAPTAAAPAQDPNVSVDPATISVSALPRPATVRLRTPPTSPHATTVRPQPMRLEPPSRTRW